MSLTLRDAQHLTWKTYRKIEKIEEKRASDFISSTELLKKAGELAEKIGQKNSNLDVGQEDFGKLLSELLFLLFVLSERFGVNLEESYLQAVDELIIGFVS